MIEIITTGDEPFFQFWLIAACVVCFIFVLLSGGQ